MIPDLTNTADVDPEGWLTKVQDEIQDFLDRFLADPGRVDEPHATRVVHHAKALIKAMQDAMEMECEHDWVDARNEVVTTGEWCRKCFAIRATPWQENLYEFKFFDGTTVRARGKDEKDALRRIGLGAYNPVSYKATIVEEARDKE